MRIHPFGPFALPTSFAFSTMYEHMLISSFVLAQAARIMAP
jgi:hypothetical protein